MKKVTLTNLKVWGCAAYVQIKPKDRRGKSQNVRWKGIFVGYSPHSPEWLILDPRSNRIRASSNVRFTEGVSGFHPNIKRTREHHGRGRHVWKPEMSCIINSKADNEDQMGHGRHRNDEQSGQQTGSHGKETEKNEVDIDDTKDVKSEPCSGSENSIENQNNEVSLCNENDNIDCR